MPGSTVRGVPRRQARGPHTGWGTARGSRPCPVGENREGVRGFGDAGITAAERKQGMPGSTVRDAPRRQARGPHTGWGTARGSRPFRHRPGPSPRTGSGTARDSLPCPRRQAQGPVAKNAQGVRQRKKISRRTVSGVRERRQRMGLREFSARPEAPTLRHGAHLVLVGVVAEVALDKVELGRPAGRRTANQPRSQASAGSGSHCVPVRGHKVEPLHKRRRAARLVRRNESDKDKAESAGDGGHRRAPRLGRAAEKRCRLHLRDWTTLRSVDFINKTTFGPRFRLVV